MVKCQIENCEKESERTLGKDRISEALKAEKLEINVRTKVTKVKICKDHYRRIKKHIN